MLARCASSKHWRADGMIDVATFWRAVVQWHWMSIHADVASRLMLPGVVRFTSDGPMGRLMRDLFTR